MEGIVDASAGVRLQAARTFLSTCAPDESVLVLAATREAAEDFLRTPGVTPPATLGWRATTPGLLALQLATPALHRDGLITASPRSMEALAARAVFRAYSEGALEHFAPVARMPGFPVALADTLTELRIHDVEPASLRALGTGGEDLAGLAVALEQELLHHRLADRALVLRLATDALAQADAPTFTTLLLLDVPCRSPRDAAFIRSLAARATRCLSTVPAGDQETLHLLAPEVRPAAQPETVLQRVQSALFATDASAIDDADNPVRVFSAPGETRECMEIARRILAEVRAGVRFDQVAVILRDPGTHGLLLETAFHRAGIPAHHARGTTRPDPAGRAFLALLTCAVEHLSARRFAEYLSLGQVPALGPDGAPPKPEAPWVPARDESQGSLRARHRSSRRARHAPGQGTLFASEEMEDTPTPAVPAPWRWEKLLVDAAVIGGADRWRRRLAGLMAELELRRDEARRLEPGSGHADRLENDVSELRALSAFALPIMDDLASLAAGEQDGAAPWGWWLTRLRALAGRVLRENERVLAVLSELQPMSAVGPVTLQEVRDVLSDPLRMLEDEPAPSRFGRVWVGTPEQARGRSFRVVLVPGLAERVFPRRVPEDPLLLDDARRRLVELGSRAVLRTQDERAAHERLQLRLAVGAAVERVHVSWSRVQQPENRARVPSFYALDVLRALRGVVPRVDQLEQDADRASGARLAWPAPPDPADAVDEIEYDLAVMRRLLSAPPGADVRGRARYVLELNSHVSRALRVRFKRWAQGWSDADGFLLRGPGPGRAALDAYRPTTRAYSVTALHKYATCPYQFLLAAVHRLAPREDAVALEQLDPLTRGAIFHEIQATTLRALQADGMLPVTSGALQKARALLDDVVTRVCAHHEERLAPALDRTWREAVRQMRADLHGWLTRVAEDTVHVPHRFELGIGFPPSAGRDPHSLPRPATLGPGVLVHGIVDLVEKDSTDGSLRVTDFKTGTNRTPVGMITAGGTQLQPTLYGMALEQLTGEKVKSGRLFFCTSAGGFSERPVPLEGLQRSQAVLALEIINSAFEKGQFLPAPSDARTCQWCDFQPICGPSEFVRIGRKEAYPRRLDELRRLP